MPIPNQDNQNNHFGASLLEGPSDAIKPPNGGLSMGLNGHSNEIASKIKVVLNQFGEKELIKDVPVTLIK